MSKPLLLHDTTEKDLARDLREFLRVLGVEVEMILYAPEHGPTLDAKEQHYIANATGAIFLLTPGSERAGRAYPSPSVNTEIGLLKERFKDRPEAVIYLVDSRCSPPTIDQKSYIQFDRTDMRTVVEALTQLVRNLKASEMLRREPPPAETPKVDIAKLVDETPALLKEICREFSSRANGMMMYGEFDIYLKTKHGMDVQKMNFTKQDLQRTLVKYTPPTPPINMGFWSLTSTGWTLVRIEEARHEQAIAQQRRTIAGIRSGVPPRTT